MGKRRMQVRQGRQQRRQVRQIKPKAPPTPTGAQQKKQRERYVAAGGLLQGYAPDLVLRIAYASIAVVVVCILAILELLFGPIAPRGLPVRIAAAIAWVVPIAFLASFVGPGARLAWTDRKREARLIQGVLMGASSISTSLGLGMIMVQTRGGGVEQFLTPPDRLVKVPGNQVQVAITVTPGLHHVKSVAVMGQRLVPRAEPPAPMVLRRLRVLPVLTPAALAVAAILGDDIVAFLPIPNDYVHAAAAALTGAALGGAVYGVSFLFQRRMMTEVQALAAARA
jgi:hypothetical protein